LLLRKGAGWMFTGLASPMLALGGGPLTSGAGALCAPLRPGRKVVGRPLALILQCAVALEAGGRLLLWKGERAT